jgi:hypothetical protein
MLVHSKRQGHGRGRGIAECQDAMEKGGKVPAVSGQSRDRPAVRVCEEVCESCPR